MTDSYESLPESSSLSTQMMAGAMAGFMEHGIMYPVDCVKTRMQCLRPPPEATYSGVTDGLYKLFTQEGIRRSFRGISAVIFGAGPAHALYFGCYEQMKLFLATHTTHSALVHGVAGACATVLHDAVMTPADGKSIQLLARCTYRDLRCSPFPCVVVKQRIQLYDSKYIGCRDCVHRVVQEEGFRALYRSYATQLLMNVPFGAAYFMTYEATQDVLNPRREYHPSTHMISGAISGGFAAGITTPLDVCKTVLNTETHPAQCQLARGLQEPFLRVRSDRFAHTATNRTLGIRHACARVYAAHGLAGFFRGAQARILQQMPSTAISWSVYEFFKWHLTAREHHATPRKHHDDAR